MVQHVYIIGSKGIPARYGGYETFVDKLTSEQKSRNVCYHVAARSDNSEYGVNKVFKYNGAEVYNIHVPNIGPAQAILYDLLSLEWAINDARRKRYIRPIFYILACRIGPFIGHYTRRIHALGGAYYVNPDGHEWKRAKWSKPVREYWKLSERLMIKFADLVICDNEKIEEYIRNEYVKYEPATTYIAYGTDVKQSKMTHNDRMVRQWYSDNSIIENEYYLIVGRFVPENNYETMIREFIASDSNKSLVIITNISKNPFYNQLKVRTKFDKDARIKFVGTVYDQQLLRYIREHAFGYIHGHEVGGTNPSLLEALSSTKLNLLLQVGFNSSVANDSALYWSKSKGSLKKLIESSDNLTSQELDTYGRKAKEIISTKFTWDKIINKYEDLFNCIGENR